MKAETPHITKPQKTKNKNTKTQKNFFNHNNFKNLKIKAMWWWLNHLSPFFWCYNF